MNIKKILNGVVASLLFTTPIAFQNVANAANVVSFSFSGACTQACEEIGLTLNDKVSANLSVHDTLLPTVLGQYSVVSNADLLSLNIIFGSQFYNFSNVVQDGETQFTLGNTGWFINNGGWLLASSGNSSILFSPAPWGQASPYMDLVYFEGLARATGTFLQTVSPVPEPATYAMMMAGFGLIGAVARRKKKHSAA